jgi:hypothetical protein
VKKINIFVYWKLYWVRILGLYILECDTYYFHYGGSLKMAQKKRENPLTVRIPEKTREHIKQAAQAQGISPNKFAANALNAAIQASQEQK